MFVIVKLINDKPWIFEERIVVPESTDYSILFYILDGCCFVVCVLSLWLTVTMRKSALTTTESLRKIWNKTSLIFFSLLFTWGLLYGVKDTYLVPYLSDDLGASSQLISEQNHSLKDYKTNMFLSYRHIVFYRISNVADRKHYGKECVGICGRT